MLLTTALLFPNNVTSFTFYTVKIEVGTTILAINVKIESRQYTKDKGDFDVSDKVVVFRIDYT